MPSRVQLRVKGKHFGGERVGKCRGADGLSEVLLEEEVALGLVVHVPLQAQGGGDGMVEWKGEAHTETLPGVSKRLGSMGGGWRGGWWPGAAREGPPAPSKEKALQQPPASPLSVQSQRGGRTGRAGRGRRGVR